MKIRSKKIISFLTALLITASCIPGTLSFAEDNGNDTTETTVMSGDYIFSAEKVQASYDKLKTVNDYQGYYTGEVFKDGTYILDSSYADRKVAEVQINIEKNSGINTGILYFDCDEDLKFIGILYTDFEKKKITNTDAQIRLAKPSAKKLLISNSKDCVDTGVLVTLLFIVPEKFEEGQKFGINILDNSSMYPKVYEDLSIYTKSGYIEMYADEIPAQPQETTAETTTPEETTVVTTTPEETTVETTTTTEETTVVTTTTTEETTVETTTTTEETTVVTTTTPEETTVVTTTTPEETTIVTTTTPEETTVVTTTPEETTAATTTTPEETTVVTTTTPEETTAATTTTPKETTVVTTTTPKETTVVTTTTPEETTAATTTKETTEIVKKESMMLVPEDISYDFSEGKKELVIGISLKNNDGVSGVKAEVEIEGISGSYEQSVVNGDFKGTLDTTKNGKMFIFTSPDGKNIDDVDGRIAVVKITLPDDISQGEYKVILKDVTVSRYDSSTGKNVDITADVINNEAGTIKITGEKIKETTTVTTVTTPVATTVSTVTTTTTTTTTKKHEETEATTTFDSNKYFGNVSPIKFSLEDIKMTEGNMGLEAVLRIDGKLPISGFQCDVNFSDKNIKVASLYLDKVDFKGDLNQNKSNNRIQFTSEYAHNIESSSGKLIKLEYKFDKALENGNYSIELSNLTASTYVEGFNQKLVPSEKLIADNESGKFEVTTYVPDIKIIEMPSKRFYYSYDTEFDMSGIKITANDKDISDYIKVNAVPAEVYNADSKSLVYEIPILLNDKEITTIPVFIGKKGDVNNDGKINSADATLIQKQANEIDMKWLLGTDSETEFDILYASAIKNKSIPENVEKDEFMDFLNFISETYVEDTLKINANDATLILKFYNQITAYSLDGIEKDDKTIWDELDKRAKK